MKLVLLAALLLAPAVCRAESYSLHDEGDFAPSGQRVEFADRFGWQSYKADFKFGLDSTGRALTKSSKLKVVINRREGGKWSYTCKAKGDDAMTANINFMYGQGISVVAECRVAERDFAKAVNLDPADVGLPNLVFQVMIQNGKVRPGAQRGFYFLPGGQIESSVLAAYASADSDPSNLAVVFRSAQPEK